MALLFQKKVVAIMLIFLIILAADFAIIYSVNAKLSEALGNAVDAAIVANMDNIGLRHALMDEMLEGVVHEEFIRTMVMELGVYYSGNEFRNNGFFRHGIKINELYTDWRDDYPLVFASVSTKVDTTLLGRLLPEKTKIEINNFDSLHWQWASANLKEFFSFI